MEIDFAELHAKTTEIDNTYAAIGSDNLDHVSWGYNRETKIVTVDSTIAYKLRRDFDEAKKKARAITESSWQSQSWTFKLVSLFFYLFYHTVYPWKLNFVHKH
eukprot:TRINITY_DN2401_c0_g1_i3.p1 TRINITY_DN2401_c0_g1~~TRINITY_DN2401_c0_g1_i3.p1  ORF type:complete len:103 (-),score=22.37 TRINITY_DN2401_c0_g1_i3:61-369(-)